MNNFNSLFKIFFWSFLIILFSCTSKPKKETEIINTEIELDSVEIVIAEEKDSVIKSVRIIPVAASPFDLVHKQPVFPGCVQQKQESKNLCFRKKVNLQIKENLNIVDFLKRNIPVGYQTVPYSFIIDKNGNVKKIVVDANPIIAQNIKQSLMKLPKFQAGTNNNKTVAVKFTDEIKFFVGKKVDNGEVKMKVGGVTIKANIPSNLTIHMVDKAPVFPGCEGKKGIPLVKCTSSKINNYIGNTINQDNLKGKNLPKGKQKFSIYFTITKKGSIADVSVQNEHKVLKDEVTRVVRSLPQMSPALFENVKVPINYRVTLTTNLSLKE